jgi:hypothetical protein
MTKSDFFRASLTFRGSDGPKPAPEERSLLKKLKCRAFTAVRGDQAVGDLLYPGTRNAEPALEGAR